MPEKSVVFIFLLSLITSCGLLPEISPQTKTNLEVFYELADSSAMTVKDNLPDKTEKLYLEVNPDGPFSVFRNRITEEIFTGGIKPAAEKENNIIVSYIIEKAEVNYGEIFRDGFLGSHYLTRNFLLGGNYSIISDSVIVRDFLYTAVDTVRVDELSNLDNVLFPFTSSEVPPEPFFSGLFEPVIALGAAALAVVLFFTIRSN